MAELKLDFTSGGDKPSPDGAGDRDADVTNWLREIELAVKREKNFRKEGSRIEKLYEGCKPKEAPFNILYSNTDTLSPALYNTTPRPVVERRFKDEDIPAKWAAKVGKRCLEVYLDPGETGNSAFDTLMEMAVLEALLPGRGITKFSFDADLETGQVKKPAVVSTQVSWNNFLHGYARTWDNVPWIAYEHLMTRQELVDNFGEEIGRATKLTVSGTNDGGEQSDEGDETTKPPENSDEVQFAQVYEIWDKAKRQVNFVSPGYPKLMKSDSADPLELEGFFNCPEPLRFFSKSSSLVPTALYKLYEEQAKELNEVTIRIKMIIKAMKVRGFYDSTLQGLDKLMQKGDNELIPAENVAAMLNGQSLDKAIWLFPIEKLINVLQQLYVQRQQIKTVIYEITGVSDILRGSSVASETATAQNIKNQWGTLRLKRMQKQVMRYVRSCLRLVLEIQVKHFPVEQLKAMTGLPLPMQAEKQAAQQQLAMMQQQAQAMQMQQQQQPQMPGQPPAPPQQPPAPPPQLLMAAQLPSWEEVKELLSNDLTRCYRVDIETNSTVDAEATEDKQNMGEFMNAMAQFMNGISPMVQQGVMPFEAAREMLLAITRRYRFGTDVEDEIAKMAAPKPPEGEGGDGGAAAKQKQAEMELQVQTELNKGKMALAQQEMEMQKQLLAWKMQAAEAEHQLEMERIRLKSEALQADAQAKAQAAITKAQTAAVQADADAAVAAAEAQSGGIKND